MNSNKYKDDEIGQDMMHIEPTSHEMMDCKRVFNRMHVPAPDVEEEWTKFCGKQDAPSEVKRTNKRSLIIGFVIGAAASVALLFGAYRYFIEPNMLKPVQVFNADSKSNDVMLTSASGDSYTLSNNAAFSSLQTKGITANKDSLVYARNLAAAQVKMMTLATPRGKDYHVTLSDGTRVWLNADSKLVFPEHFMGAQRVVRLEGEAYFEVSKDKAHPFIVNAKTYTTQVLGTKFNMRAYGEHDANVVLLEGKVMLTSKNAPGYHQTLSPGEKAELTESGAFSIHSVDTYAYTQWKDGYFYFNNVPLVDIMQEMGRWYNVDIIIENPQKMRTRLHFVADRNQSLSVALSNLNMMEDVHATLVDNKVYIK
jgi:transmembrane sensor